CRGARDRRGARRDHRRHQRARQGKPLRRASSPEWSRACGARAEGEPGGRMRVLAGEVGSVLPVSLALAALPGAAVPSTAPLAGAAGSVSATPVAPMSPRAAKAIIKTARASMQSGRSADALKQYETVLASRPSSEDSRAEALSLAGVLRM